MGIDPGLTATGYGVIETDGRRESLAEAGVIRPGGRELGQRLVRIHRAMLDVLEEWRPDAIAIEEVYSKYHHPRTAILMGHARGVICLAAASLCLEVVHYEASRVRSVLTGNGRASEPQMRSMVCRCLSIAPESHNDHIFDALALALCHAGRARETVRR